MEALQRVIEAAPPLGVSTVTVYAFSGDNWKRPQAEVQGLLGLLGDYLQDKPARLAADGVRLSFIGRRDRVPAALRAAMAGAERATSAGDRLHLRVAFDYSGRDMLLAAAQTGARERCAFASALGRAQGGGEPAPDVDLLIRTGGEHRLSDFLLWECAYAELLFTPCMWPDFGPEEFRTAVEWFRSRARRYGALPELAVPA